MTETEFSSKLTQVSDAKLLKMLEASRREGPDVALKMILAEGKVRGWETPNPLPIKADWLEEEKSASTLSKVVKAALFLGALGGLIFGAYKFMHRG